MNREAELRHGARSDLLIQTKDANAANGETWSVVIEVKWSDHREVNTTMKSKLLDRYLSSTSMNHGIYLVGL
ncbi:MAG: hypothetical protein IPK13_27625 [Deltaproteobacteria bacterium]|nr:hypothetical protein [Deltaproteobacteria bacterium]